MVEVDYCDQESILIVDFDVYLIHYWGVHVYGLEPLWSNKLTILEFLVLFSPLDDFNGSIREDGDDVAYLEPATFVEHFACHDWILEVAKHDAVTFHV